MNIGARRTPAHIHGRFTRSGTTLTLPSTCLANAIAAEFGTRGTDLNGFYSVDCALAAIYAPSAMYWFLAM